MARLKTLLCVAALIGALALTTQRQAGRGSLEVDAAQS